MNLRHILLIGFNLPSLDFVSKQRQIDHRLERIPELEPSPSPGVATDSLWLPRWA